MRFNQDFIEKVRDASNLVDIIGQYTELKGNGSRMMGRCPFPDHGDKTPSFSVSQDSQLYFCYGCKKGGNIFTFLESFNGMSFPEAVEFLARRASIAMPEPEHRSTSTSLSSEDKKTLYAVNRAAAVYYFLQFKNLAESHPANLYFQTRGLSAEIVEKFRLGVSLETWDGLHRFLIGKKAPIAAAEKLGLVKLKKSVQGGYFDLFRERLIFPIFSPTDEVVGFGGRTYTDAMPKYLNSSESPVFSKGKTLYGLHETGKYLRSEDEVVVVEGYMDALALYAAGIKNVVAILGTALTADHAKVLKRYTANVKMLLDGDNAGMNAAERSLPILLQAGLRPKGCFLPNGMDPDDFVKTNGAAALKTELQNAPDLFTLILKRATKEFRGASSEKVQIMEELSATLLSTSDERLRDLCMLEVAQSLDVSPQWVRSALQRVVNGQSNAQSVVANSFSRVLQNPSQPTSVNKSEEEGSELLMIAVKGAPRDEAFLVSLALRRAVWMEELNKPENLNLILHSGLRKLLELAVKTYGQRPNEFDKLAASLASRIDQPSIVTYASEVLSEASDETEERKLMSDYLTSIRRRSLKDQARSLAHQLKDQASPEKLEQFMNIQRDRRSLERE